MIPSDRYYTATDLWVKLDDSVATLGITDHAQQELGDIVFVELPATDQDIDKDAECVVIESTKAATEITAPLAGRVVETNARLGTAPELINSDPYGEGWLVKLQLTDRTDKDTLLDHAAYEALPKDL